MEFSGKDFHIERKATIQLFWQQFLIIHIQINELKVLAFSGYGETWVIPLVTSSLDLTADSFGLVAPMAAIGLLTLLSSLIVLFRMSCADESGWSV